MVYSKKPKRSRGLRVSSYEPSETAIISHLLKSGNTIVNLGAHRGHYTAVFANIVGDTGKVFAFEPEPNNFTILKHTIERKGLKNVILEQKAVSNKSGKVRLYLNPQNPGDHRIYDSLDGRHSIEVEAVSLNDYFRNYTGRIDFIKMDIQGAEMAALQGMSSLLNNNPGVIIASEFWPWGLKTFGVEPVDYLMELLRYGYRLENMNERSKSLELINDLNFLLSVYTIKSKRYTNLLATR